MVLLLDWGALCVLCPAWHIVGRTAQKLKLPLITGYLLGGVLCGPYVLDLLHSEALANFRLLDHTCLAVIALAAGAEVNFGELKRTRKQVTSITLCVALFSWTSVYGAMMLLAPLVPFLHAHGGPAIAAMAALAGTIAVARSPASAIAVLNEVSGKGPFCSLVMSVVVVKDVLTFVCFAVSVEMATLLLNPGDSPKLIMVFQPMLSLLLSVLLGFAGNVLLTACLRAKGGRAREATKWLKCVALICVAGSTFTAAELLGGEALLSCVLVGLMTVNKRSDTLVKEMCEEVEEALLRVMPALQVLFFGLVGAALKLDALLGSLWVAAVIFCVRLVAVYFGSWLGAWLGGAPSESRKRLWAGMVTQAGIALGLAKTAAGRFPDWGPDFASVMASVVIMNLAAGPPLFKAAVMAAGESRSTDVRTPGKGDSRAAGKGHVHGVSAELASIKVASDAETSSVMRGRTSSAGEATLANTASPRIGPEDGK